MLLLLWRAVQFITHAVDKICVEVLSGSVTNMTELQLLFDDTSNGDFTSPHPALIGFTNGTDWTVPHCTLQLYGHDIVVSLVNAFNEAIGTCPSANDELSAFYQRVGAVMQLIPGEFVNETLRELQTTPYCNPRQATVVSTGL